MNKYHKEWLIGAYRRQKRLKFLFFWGHQPAKDGSVAASCFSQWWIAPFEVDGNRYASAEHWMMAQKAMLFRDTDMAARIRNAASPAGAKKLGREVKGFDGVLWDQEKFEIVRQGNVHKFGQHPALGAFLEGAGSSILVEASPVDPVWGESGEYVAPKKGLALIFEHSLKHEGARLQSGNKYVLRSDVMFKQKSQ